MPHPTDPQPFHEPIGMSPENVSVSRRWILASLLVVVVLVAGVVAWVRLA